MTRRKLLGLLSLGALAPRPAAAQGYLNAHYPVIIKNTSYGGSGTPRTPAEDATLEFEFNTMEGDTVYVLGSSDIPMLRDIRQNWVGPSYVRFSLWKE
jgi:hypothetical protein